MATLQHMAIRQLPLEAMAIIYRTHMENPILELWDGTPTLAVVLLLRKLVFFPVKIFAILQY